MSPVTTGPITELDSRLTELDRSLISLARERAETAAQLRAMRRMAGQRDFQLTRENDVLSQYHEALGQPGTAIALQLRALSQAERTSAAHGRAAVAGA
ncbi:chorismate mutase [Streptomyces sp. NPDC088725]|uniref:chorismate mutase n=1 Tax=Streptomyces sp. NPDC088725 TaxID=3365873 RepID=UPI003816500B